MVHLIVTACLLYLFFDLLSRGKLLDAILGVAAIAALFVGGAFMVYLPVAVFITRDREFVQFAGYIILGGIALVVAYGVIRECVSNASAVWQRAKWPVVCAVVIAVLAQFVDRKLLVVLSIVPVSLSLVTLFKGTTKGTNADAIPMPRPYVWVCAYVGISVLGALLAALFKG